MARRQAALLAVLVAAAPPAHALTIHEAMAEAVRSNPNVLATRQAARFRHEELPLALSAWRPTVEASVTASRTRIGSAPVAGVTDVRIPVFADDGSLVGRPPVLPVPVSGGVSSDHDGREALELVLTQNLCRGGGRKAVLGHAEEVVRLGHADVEDAEQQVLLRTATVYLDVLRAEGFVALREASLAAFEAHARDTRAQYRVGDRTRADVAQAEAERDVAAAEVAAAQADLEVQRARFETLIGLPPEDLEAPGEPDGLPETLEAARRAAESERPVVRVAVHAERAASQAVRAAAGDLGPRIDLTGAVTRTLHHGSSLLDSTDASVGLRLAMPFYQGGAGGGGGPPSGAALSIAASRPTVRRAAGGRAAGHGRMAQPALGPAAVRGARSHGRGFADRPCRHPARGGDRRTHDTGGPGRGAEPRRGSGERPRRGARRGRPCLCAPGGGRRAHRTGGRGRRRARSRTRSRGGAPEPLAGLDVAPPEPLIGPVSKSAVGAQGRSAAKGP